MGTLLKLLALMALVVSFLPAHAGGGLCKKGHPDWDPKTKTCPEKPAALVRAPAPPRAAASAPVPAPLPVSMPEPPRSQLVMTSQQSVVIPGGGYQVEGMAVATCHGFVSIPGFSWTARPARVESTRYELQTLPVSSITKP